MKPVVSPTENDAGRRGETKGDDEKRYITVAEMGGSCNRLVGKSVRSLQEEWREERMRTSSFAAAWFACWRGQDGVEGWRDVGSFLALVMAKICGHEG